MLTKHYVADLVSAGNLVGSYIVSVWFWQTARHAYSAINSVSGNCGIINFRRVK